MRKLFASILIAVTMFVTGSTVMAEENTYQNGDWIYSSATDKIVKWAGVGKDVVIPENSVVDSVFKFNSRGLHSSKEGEYIQIESFVVSEGVTIEGSLNMFAYEKFKKIEFYNNAEQMPKVNLDFRNMEGLTVLKLPEGLTKIEDDMCNGCYALETVYIPDSVETIGEYAFCGCEALTNFEFPSNIKTLGENAFKRCRSIKSLYIPASVDYTAIDVYVDLEEVEFEKDPEHTREFYKHFMHTAWMQKKIIPTIDSDFIVVDNYLVKYIGRDKSIVIPDEVTVIDEAAFYQSDITDVKIHNKVTEIHNNAFGQCMSLKEVTIPSSVNVIGEFAFWDCGALEKVTIEGDCLIYGGAFANCYALTYEGINLSGEIIYDTDSEFEADPLVLHNKEYLPTEKPTKTTEPTEEPTTEPTTEPTAEPTETPTENPTSEPVEQAVLTVTSTADGLIVATNGKEVDFGEELPFIDENGRTQIPIRAVAEALGCEVSWDEETYTATLTKGDKTVIIKIGSADMQSGSEIITMDTIAQIVNDRTYIPVRFAGEALGLKVEWVSR